MAITISLFNHTAAKFADGSFAAGDTYKLLLATSATFDATATTLAGLTYTQVAGANGYTTGGQALTGVAVTTVTTNDAKLDANDVVWNASGGSISASFGILYNDTDASDPPVLFINFDGARTALDGSPLTVQWAAGGIVTFTVA